MYIRIPSQTYTTAGLLQPAPFEIVVKSPVRKKSTPPTETLHLVLIGKT